MYSRYIPNITLLENEAKKDFDECWRIFIQNLPQMVLGMDFVSLANKDSLAPELIGEVFRAPLQAIAEDPTDQGAYTEAALNLRKIAHMLATILTNDPFGKYPAKNVIQSHPFYTIDLKASNGSDTGDPPV